jgi:hypothetical protein
MVSQIVPEVKMKASVESSVKALSSGVATLVAMIQHQHHQDQLSLALERNMCVMERKTVPRVKVRHRSIEAVLLKHFITKSGN